MNEKEKLVKELKHIVTRMGIIKSKCTLIRKINYVIEKLQITSRTPSGYYLRKNGIKYDLVIVYQNGEVDWWCDYWFRYTPTSSIIKELIFLGPL